MKILRARRTLDSLSLRSPKDEVTFYEMVRKDLALQIAMELVKSDDIFTVENDPIRDGLIVTATFNLPEKRDLQPPKVAPPPSYNYKPLYAWFDEIADIDPLVLNKLKDLVR